MQIPRRFLPSIGLLTAFEAAARHASFTAAARELNLTQSAVSRQVRALEEQIGVELFTREKQTVRLTQAGEAYAREIRGALQRIASASLNLRANPGGGTLNLAILPTFGTRWLAPRLPAFLAANPGITVNLSTRLTAFDFRLDTMDAAIHFGAADWSGADHLLLMSEMAMPVASPAFVTANPEITDPSALLGLPLLHITSRPDAWERWFSANGISAVGLTGMLFDQFATIAQAAMAGIGIALLPTFLIEQEIARLELVPVLDLPLRSVEEYFLVWPRERDSYPPLVAFRAWVKTLRGV